MANLFDFHEEVTREKIEARKRKQAVNKWGNRTPTRRTPVAKVRSTTKWYETEEGYPEEVKDRVAPPTALAVEEKAPVATVPQLSPTPQPPVTSRQEFYETINKEHWASIKQHFSKYFPASEETAGTKGKAFSANLNAMFGAPWGADNKGTDSYRGLFYKDVFRGAFEGLSETLRYSVGLRQYMNPDKAEELEALAYTNALPTQQALASGNFVPYMRDMMGGEGFDEAEEISWSEKEFADTQEDYNRARKRLIDKGMSVEEAENEAFHALITGRPVFSKLMQKVWDSMKAVPPPLIGPLLQSKDLTSYVETGGLPNVRLKSTPWNALKVGKKTGDYSSAYGLVERAKGFRYSIDGSPIRTAYRDSLVAEGFDYTTAAYLAEDTLNETINAMVFDPNWVANLDNALLKGVGAAIKGTTKLATKIPGVKGAVAALTEYTYKTNAAILSRQGAEVTDSFLQYFSKIEAEKMTDDMFREFVSTPPPAMWANMTDSLRNAFTEVAKNLDVAAGSFKRAIGAKAIQEAQDEAAKMLMHFGKLKQQAGTYETLVRVAMRKQITKAVGKALHESIAQAYVKAHPGLLSRMGFIGKGAKAVMTEWRTLMVDNWLRINPGWSIRNYLDNVVRVSFKGAGAFDGLPDLLTRIKAYTPDPSVVDDVVKGMDYMQKHWGKTSNELVVDMLYTTLPRESVGVFGETIADELGSKVFSALGKIPLLGAGLNKLGNWNVSLSGRIESTMSARLYMQKFIEMIEKEWPTTVAESLNPAAASLTPDVLTALRSRLLQLNSPTPEAIEGVLKSILEGGEVAMLNPDITQFAATLRHLPPAKANQIMGDITDMFSVKDVPVTVERYNGMFDSYARELAQKADDALQHGLTQFRSASPDMPDDLGNVPKLLKSIKDYLLPDVKTADAAQLKTAFDDLPSHFHAYEAQQRIVSKTMMDSWEAAHDAGTLTYEELHRLMREFYKGRGVEFTAYNRAQMDFMYEMADRADELHKALGNKKLRRFPRGVIEDYEKAVNDLNAANNEQMLRTWSQYWRERYNTPIGKRAELKALASTKVGNDIEVSKHYVKDAIGNARNVFQTWFSKLPGNGRVPLASMATDTGWWRYDTALEAANRDAFAIVSPMYDDLKNFYQELSINRLKTVVNVPVTPADRAALETLLPSLQEQTRKLVSKAQDEAIAFRHATLIDYEKTPQWMDVLNNVIPFSRYKTRSFALWADIFANTPHLPASVYWARKVQKEYNLKQNPNLPSRSWYTIPILKLGDNKVFQYLGIDNAELRINPWSYLGFTKMIPGMSQSQIDRFDAIDSDEDSKDLDKAVRLVFAFMSEMDVAGWPNIDYMLGIKGLLGDSWYPNQLMGWWQPFTQWAIAELSGGKFDAANIDYLIRKEATHLWNLTFGVINEDWKAEQINPDNMEKWLAGRLAGDTILGWPDEVQALLVNITPTMAYQTVKGLEEVELDRIAKQVMPIMNMRGQEAVDAVAALSDVERHVMLYLVETNAIREAIRQQMAVSVLGAGTGAYFTVVTQETEGNDLSMKRRVALAGLPAGEEKRKVVKDFIDNNPGYVMYQNYRFAANPWGNKSWEEEAGHWDALMDDAKTKYYDWSVKWYEDYQDAIDNYIRTHPGDFPGLDALEDKWWGDRQTYIDSLNQSVRDSISERYQAYITGEGKNDPVGVAKLTEGWNIEEYVGYAFTEKDRQALRLYKQANPTDSKGYDALYVKLYQMAKERSSGYAEVFIPGFKDGWKGIDVSRNPQSYSYEENKQYESRQLLRELNKQAPQLDEYDDYDQWEIDKVNFMETLPDLAIKTEQAKKQIQELVEMRGITTKEATAIVKGWYTEEEMRRMWRANHSPMQALAETYRNSWNADAKREFYEEILPLKEKDYDAYRLAYIQFIEKNGAVPATKLIPMVMQLYSERGWTADELWQAYDGVTLPSYEDFELKNKKGPKAIDNYIYSFYNKLNSEQRKMVRQAFGATFTDTFLGGASEDVAIELRGQWLTELSNMVQGTAVDWKTLPGMQDTKMQERVQKERKEFGLPQVDALDESEFEEAKKLDKAYYLARESGDTAKQDEIENNAVWNKWFGSTSSRGYFWNMYYDKIPPGFFSKELRDNPIMQLLLEGDVASMVATNEDYENAVELMESWLALNSDAMFSLGLDEAEFAEVRRLSSLYYDIEDKAARKAFLKENPTLAKYLEEVKKSSSGSGDSEWVDYGYTKRGFDGGGGLNYNDAWYAFSSRAGNAVGSVLPALGDYWSNGTPLPAAVEEYLKDLWTELSPGMSFTDWLRALSIGYGMFRKAKGVTPPEAPPTPYYERTSRGYRR